METCEKCPNKDSALGCPCWLGPEAGLIEENPQTGETRLMTGCFYQIIPKLMVHVIVASNRPAAAIETIRNEIASGLANLGQVMRFLPIAPPKDGSNGSAAP